MRKDRSSRPILSGSRILTLASTLYILIVSAQACSIGCLMCDTSLQKCVICDWKNGFNLSQNETCLKSKMKECLIPDVDKPGCLQCNENRFQDPYSLHCFEISEALKIENCVFYDSSKNCRKCENEYVAMGKECVKTTAINYCQYHVNSKICGQCIEGYNLAIDFKSCEKDSLPDCKLTSKFECRQCANNYRLTDEAFFKSDPVSAILHITNWPIFETSFRGLRSLSCLPVKSIQNCLEHDSFGYCEKCDSGFGIEPYRKFCVPIEPSIDFCKQYLTIDTCTECHNYFFLQSSKVCSPVDPVEHCEDYEGTASSTICKRCSDTHFRFSNKLCLERAKSKLIVNCVEKSFNQDVCVKCGEGFHISGDKTRCLVSISKCQEYLDVSREEEDHLTCLRCDPGYYYSHDLARCRQGTVMNCEVFENFADGCEICANGFLTSDDGGCVPHNFIARCQSYSQTQLNKCVGCAEPHLLLTYQHMCQPFTPVEYCLEYGQNSCVLCKKGFKIENGFCMRLTLPMNCLEGSDHDFCTKCRDFFYLNKISDSKIECKPATKTQTFAVLQNNTSSQTYEILGCVSNAFLDKSPAFSSLCWSNSDPSHIDFKTTGFIANCGTYFKKNSSEIECVACKEDFYLSELGCVSSCKVRPVVQFVPGVLDPLNISRFNICDSTSFYVGLEKGMIDMSQNCEQTSRNFMDLDDPNMYCVECTSDLEIYPVLDLSKITGPLATLNDPRSESFDVLSFNLMGFECLHREKIQQKLTQNVAHCAMYKLTEKGDFACLTCDFGYVARMKAYTISLETRHFIEECLPFSSCDTSSKYSNQGLSNQTMGPLNFPLSSAVTCHQCKNASEHLILFGAVENKMLVPSSYSAMVSSTQQLGEGTGDPHMTCSTLEGLETIFNDLVLVQDCALHFVNVKIATKFGQVNETVPASNLGVHCLACKDGFKPVYSSNGISNLRIVIDCTPILNCNTSSPDLPKIFNHCGACNDTFVRKSDPSKIFFDRCVSLNQNLRDLECLTLDESTSRCTLCRPGFAIGPEGMCDVVSYHMCSEYSQAFQEPNISELPLVNSDFPGIRDFSVYYKLKMHPTRGCGKCDEGYSAILGLPEFSMCAISQNFKDKIFSAIPEHSRVIQDCESHFQDSTLKTACYKCQNNFIPTSDRKSCVLKDSNNQLCTEILSKDPLKCSKCVLTAIQIGDNCQIPDIKNCVKPATSLILNKIICEECLKDHFFNSKTDTCEPGNVPNCDEFDTDAPDVCKRCTQSHIYIASNPTLEKCVYIPHSDCLALSISGSSLLCSKCPPFTSLVDMPDSKSDPSFSYQTSSPLTISHCLPKAAIPNCISYFPNSSTEHSSASCSECLGLFYLSSDRKSCVYRSQQVSHCAEYSKTSQDCVKCDQGFLQSGNTCVAYPKGTQNCKYFKDTEECQECEPGFYLDRGKCFRAAIIPGCKRHAPEKKCFECLDGYNLKEDKTACDGIKFSNCKRVESGENGKCLECMPSYLQISEQAATEQSDTESVEESQTKCVKQSDVYCLEYEDNVKQICSKCKDDYALNNELVCEILGISIPNCRIQESGTLCRKCERAYYLSTDQTSCVELSVADWYFVDPLCSDIYKKAESECRLCKHCVQSSTVNSQCLGCGVLSANYISKESRIDLYEKLGYSFTVQEALKDYFETSCEICTMDKCIICKTGFYMDINGLCRGDYSQLVLEKVQEVVFENPYDYEEEFDSENIFWLCGIWGWLGMLAFLT